MGYFTGVPREYRPDMAYSAVLWLVPVELAPRHTCLGTITRCMVDDPCLLLAAAPLPHLVMVDVEPLQGRVAAQPLRQLSGDLCERPLE